MQGPFVCVLEVEGGSPYLTLRLFPKEARGQAPWECPDGRPRASWGWGWGEVQAQTDLRSSGTEVDGAAGKRSMGVSWRGSPPAALSRTMCFSLCFSVADQLAYQVPPAHACSPRTPARASSPSRGSLEACGTGNLVGGWGGGRRERLHFQDFQLDLKVFSPPFPQRFPVGSLDLQGSDLSGNVSWQRTLRRYLLTWQSLGIIPLVVGEPSGYMMAIPTAKQALFINKPP